MNKKERIYSVTMTEGEFKLFSKFLEQKVYARDSENQSHEIEIIPKPSPIQIPFKPEDDGNVLNDNYRIFPLTDKQRKDIESYRKNKLEQSKKTEEHNSSKKFIDENFNKKESLEQLKKDGSRMTARYISEKNPELQESQKVVESSELNDPNKWSPTNPIMPRHLAAANKIKAEKDEISNLLSEEKRLKRIGYDDKYSAKGLEKVLGKKIDADEAKNIIKGRSNLANTYTTNNEGNIIELNDGSIKGAVGDLGRRWDDAKMVYGEALDGRSLGKDAAIAAGSLAAAGLAVHAIRKHRKKKREVKKAADKFKTSKED